MSIPRSFCRINFAIAVAALFLVTPSAYAERPSAPKLLPADTLAYLRVHDAQELVEKFKETAVGKMGQNESIKPLVGQLYGSAAEAFSQIEEQVGLPLEKILALPQGELCAAMVAPKTGPPAFVGIIDVGSQLPSALKLLERGEQLAEQNGALRTTEEVDGVTLTVFDTNGETFAYFAKDDTIVISMNVDVAKQIIARWDGKTDKDSETQTLADNQRFVTILNQSKGTKDERPQISWYVDPIELAKTMTRGNFTAQTGLALLPVLGLDGLKAVGGSIILAPEDFDSIIHLHVVLDNPRAGVLKMFALRGGETTPEPWVPEDAAGYLTFNWDVDTTFKTLASLYDSFNEEGALSAAIERRFSDRLGVDVEKEVIGALEGRFTWVTWMEPPARINSQANLVAFKLNDAKKFNGTLDKVLGTIEQPVESEMFGGIKIYRGPAGRVQPPEREGLPAPRLRQPQPCFAVMGDYFVISDSQQFLKHAITTKGNSARGLANDIEYQLIASKIKRQLNNKEAGMINFNRPEQTFRLLYDLATGAESRGNLAVAAESNDFFRVVNSALNDNPLPPFEELSKHLAPGGGVMTNDASGIHYIGFWLKRD